MDVSEVVELVLNFQEMPNVWIGVPRMLVVMWDRTGSAPRLA